jgi:hypothetical protein
MHALPGGEVQTLLSAPGAFLDPQSADASTKNKCCFVKAFRRRHAVGVNGVLHRFLGTGDDRQAPGPPVGYLPGVGEKRRKRLRLRADSK